MRERLLDEQIAAPSRRRHGLLDVQVAGGRDHGQRGAPGQPLIQRFECDRETLLAESAAPLRVGLDDCQRRYLERPQVGQMTGADRTATDYQYPHVSTFGRAYSERNSPITSRSLYAPSWNRSSRHRPSIRKPTLS